MITQRYEYLSRFQPERIGIAYRCDSCNDPIFLRFSASYDPANGCVSVSDNYEEIERPAETFDFKYLPSDVGEDFAEALSCYSSRLLNAFAAMCRRTIQSVCIQLGATGSDKIITQLKDLKELAEIEDETFSILKQIIIDGHDGAHPHLPKLNASRAAVLLELIKDVLYQLYVRPGKLKEAAELRRAAINAKSGAA